VDTEFLLRASQKGLTVKVIDVHLRPGITFSNFGYKILKTELHNLLSLVRLQHRLKKEKNRASIFQHVLTHTVKIVKMY
jgi:hypothetical protein